MYHYKKKSHTVRLCDLGAHACNAPLFGPLRPIHRWRIVLFRNLLTTQCQCGGTPSCWMVKHQTSQQYIPYSGRRNHQFSTHSTSELFGTTNKALSNTLHIFVRNMRTACWFPFAQITCIFELFVPTSNTLSSRRFNTVLSMKFMLHCCNRFNTSKHHTQKKKAFCYINENWCEHRKRCVLANGHRVTWLQNWMILFETHCIWKKNLTKETNRNTVEPCCNMGHWVQR